MPPISLCRRPLWATMATAAAFAALAGSGCSPLGVATTVGAAVGTAAVEERGIGGTVRDGEIKLALLKRYDVEDVLFRGIAATVMEGRVLLTGQTSDAAVRTKAVDLAWSINGVKEVINEVVLTSTPATGTDARDALIETELRAAIMFDPDVLAINYAIDVDDGIVYILGIAQSDAERHRVAAHARGTDFVRRVVDHSILKTDPRRFHEAPPRVAGATATGEARP